MTPKGTELDFCHKSAHPMVQLCLCCRTFADGDLYRDPGLGGLARKPGQHSHTGIQCHISAFAHGHAASGVANQSSGSVLLHGDGPAGRANLTTVGKNNIGVDGSAEWTAPMGGAHSCWKRPDAERLCVGRALPAGVVDGVLSGEDNLGNGHKSVPLLEKRLDDGRQGLRGVEGGVVEQDNGPGLHL